MTTMFGVMRSVAGERTLVMCDIPSVHGARSRMGTHVCMRAVRNVLVRVVGLIDGLLVLSRYGYVGKLNLIQSQTWDHDSGEDAVTKLQHPIPEWPKQVEDLLAEGKPKNCGL